MARRTKELNPRRSASIGGKKFSPMDAFAGTLALSDADEPDVFERLSSGGPSGNLSFGRAAA